MTVVFPDSIVGFNAADSLVLPAYVELFIKSVRARIEAYAPATAQKNINLTTLENLIVPLCSLPEQQAIVARLESSLSTIEHQKKTIDKQLRSAAALRQSILKKAFSGQLVAQDPNDEPASALLERDQSPKSCAISQRQTPQQAPARQGNGMTGKLPINLDRLLRQRTVESERIEYKAGWNPKSVLHAICAFANDFHNLGGGYVILGVKEKNGRPVLPPKGISSKRIDAIQNELLDLGHSAMRPHYHPLTATYRVKGRNHPRAVGARRRNSPIQGQSESGERTVGLGLFHSQAQQYRARQGRRRTRIAQPWPLLCPLTTAIVRHLRRKIFPFD